MTGITDLQNDLLSSSQGPGRLLRQARESVKLSLDDLSAQIKLARSTLDALEHDDFAHLNEPVYVRGYYRKLSKVLPVLEADLIAAYDRVAGHKTIAHPSKLILAGGEEMGDSRRVSFKTAAVIIVIGLLLGVLAFWGKNRGAESTAPAVTVAPATIVVPAASAPEPVNTVPLSEMPGTDAPVSLSPEPQAETQPVATPTPVAETAQVSAASSGSGVLKIQFNGSSWVEVKDATGKVLLSGLIEAGNSQALDGRAPFVVFLGNAPGVTITYNGQPVDTTSFRRSDNTARITLP